MRKIVSALLAAVMLIGLLAACDGGGKDAGGSNTPQANEGNQTVSTPAAVPSNTPEPTPAPTPTPKPKPENAVEMIKHEDTSAFVDFLNETILENSGYDFLQVGEISGRNVWGDEYEPKNFIRTGAFLSNSEIKKLYDFIPLRIEEFTDATTGEFSSAVMYFHNYTEYANNEAEITLDSLSKDFIDFYFGEYGDYIWEHKVKRDGNYITEVVVENADGNYDDYKITIWPSENIKIERVDFVSPEEFDMSEIDYTQLIHNETAKTAIDQMFDYPLSENRPFTYSDEGGKVDFEMDKTFDYTKYELGGNSYCTLQIFGRVYYEGYDNKRKEDFTQEDFCNTDETNALVYTEWTTNGETIFKMNINRDIGYNIFGDMEEQRFTEIEATKNLMDTLNQREIAAFQVMIPEYSKIISDCGWKLTNKKEGPDFLGLDLESGTAKPEQWNFQTSFDYVPKYGIGYTLEYHINLEWDYK